MLALGVVVVESRVITRIGKTLQIHLGHDVVIGLRMPLSHRVCIETSVFARVSVSVPLRESFERQGDETMACQLRETVIMLVLSAIVQSTTATETAAQRWHLGGNRKSVLSTRYSFVRAKFWNQGTPMPQILSHEKTFDMK